MTGLLEQQVGREIVAGPTRGGDETPYRATLEAAQVGIFALKGRHFRYVNPRLASLLGYTAEELIGRLGPLDLVVAEQRVALLRQMRSRGPGLAREERFELDLMRKDGSVFPAAIFGSLVGEGDNPVAVGTLIDISAQKTAENRGRELADLDALTGLPNRRLFREQLARMLGNAHREGCPVTLLAFDLDHFKRVNDSLGHSVGDELLFALAGRLSRRIRGGDILAHLGGDEFVLALPGLEATTIVERARQLLDECAAPFSISGHELTLTASVGIVTFPRDGGDVESLLKNADVALHAAKSLGRNAFQFYAEEMNLASLDRLLLASSLRRALAQEEFLLHYQPLVCLRSGRILGVEALVRWRHPELGMIAPDRFIPLAEDSGLINPLGDWVLTEACRQAQSWIEAGLAPVTLAVNVSPVQFRQTGFVETVAGALAASGLPPAQLELELTERTVMNDAELNVGTLSALHRMGVGLSLDDFGTGYSSLSYLRRFPVGKLKIDRSFIHDLEDNDDGRAIAATIVSMGRNLRLTVLAEGVETAAQRALLDGMRCDMAQGYLFSRPLPAERMTELLRTQPFLHEE